MAWRTLTLAAALVSTALAGCIGANDEVEKASLDGGLVTNLLYELGAIVNVELALPDGLTAHGTVYVPDVPDGLAVPTLLDLGPYYWDTDSYSEKFPPNILYFDFLQRGYAIALVSLRGTGLSQGCFKIGGAEEWADAAAIVQGLAAQPWSDGTVAMTGVSYDGTTPWEAAVMAPPALKAIVPVEGITDMYRYSFYEGASIWGGPLFNTYYSVYVDFGYLGENLPQYVANQPSNACTETAQAMLEDYETFIDGVHDAFWDERDTVPEFSRIEAATFVVHGLQDWNVKMDHVQHVWDHLPEPKRMLLGQWEHNIPWRSSFHKEWSIPWYNATVAEWLDAYVRADADARARAEALAPVAFQDSRGAWHNVSAWPPEDGGWVENHLRADGGLSRDDAGKAGALTFQTQLHDNQGQGMATDLGLPGPGFEARFLSAPARQAVWLVGNPLLNLTLSVELPTGGYLTAYLYDANPSGNYEPGDGRFLITKGHLSLAQREGRDRAVDVPTGTRLDVSIPLYAVAHVVEAGHTLELVLESEDHEGWADTSYRRQVFTLALGEGSNAALHLPVWTPSATT